MAQEQQEQQEQQRQDVQRRDDGWVLVEDGVEVARVAAEPAGDGVVALTHTSTDPDRRGEGLAGLLVAGALADLRADDLRVRPDCPYVASWLEDHPDEKDLVAS
ncbi:GNAT family N-acetyltransferase [Pseudokineococcus basanitobsidens]|uniref:GNAT family N-acetyltransferase n=1 Tax=Pseudokineococcus basanitobsidens TaxID=1926649 RepID=A0ABU8RM71_9ACTN